VLLATQQLLRGSKENATSELTLAIAEARALKKRRRSSLGVHADAASVSKHVEPNPVMCSKDCSLVVA